MRPDDSFLSLRRGARADLGLALLVVAIVALMVVPLPTWLLDVLLASNLAISVAILLGTLYVGSALEISSFPSLLVITTLVRVSLNVASTRLILLQADAGTVIRSFGEFVVRGDFVVGAVVFVILTIVQFVVVAKGSERVAEVGARFTLDALPGKQMAIEAELRNGAIDAAEARLRQKSLERESHFYGAMDGAVKFVKGDVIASLLIAVVNLVGGSAIGVGQRHLGFASALRTYGILTIGDGLVTQIPALLLATAAGILVTRVASSVPNTALGRELAEQLFGMPRALFVAALIVAGLAAVPGLPAPPFLFIAVVLFGAAIVGRTRREGRLLDGELPEFAGDEARFVPGVLPWSLEVSPDLARLLSAPALSSLAERLRRQVFRERGVPLPACRVTEDSGLPERHLVLSIHEVPARVLAVPAGLDAAATLAHVEQAALVLLLARAADFLGIAETRSLLDRLERRVPATVRQVVPKLVEVSLLSDVLRRLVEEGVSIRDLKGILEAIARAPGAERDALSLAESVRAELRRALTWDLAGGASELGVVVIDPSIEDVVRGAVSRTAAGSFLVLAPAAARDIVAAIERALGEAAEPDAPGVVLTRPDIRRFVRKLIETDLPEVRVVSYAELLPELIVKPRARATLSGL